MWNDIETTTDYLHFSVVSQAVADMIIESGKNPISIGVSGSWGSGKSSMVKMIGQDLKNRDKKGESFIFLEFNAWLYQGFDDAKNALLQSVSKTLSLEMNAIWQKVVLLERHLLAFVLRERSGKVQCLEILA